MDATMSDSPAVGAVLFAKDLQRVAAFYAALLSLTPRLSGPDLVVLDGAGFQLVVHPIPKKIAASITITQPPARRTDLPIKMFVAVASLDAARAVAGALGGEMNPPKGEFEARGLRMCDGHDPEGNVFQLRQRVA
jgi:predicted enzyme related to lactoylglutathione lyase